jgi:two-component system response regulator YesN
LKLKRWSNSTAFGGPLNQPEPYSGNQSHTLDKRILKVRETVENDLVHSWTAQELSLLVNLSSSHLRQLFKDETGTTLGRYLKELRMHVAKTLLVSEFLSVKEAMNRVGIGNYSHFSKDFKRTHGMAPSTINKSKSRT